MRWFDQSPKLARVSSRFQQTMRAINLSNRIYNFMELGRLINKITLKLSESPQGPALADGVRKLSEINAQLRKALQGLKSRQTVVSQVEDLTTQLKQQASNLIPLAEGSSPQGSLFSELDKPKPVATKAEPDDGMEQAMPADFVAPGEIVVDEPGSLEPVTAAKNPPKTVASLLSDLYRACDTALSFEPENFVLRLNLMRRYFHNGQEGIDWYDDISATLRKYFGQENAAVFAKLLAATSPRTSVKRNLEKAIVAFNSYINEYKNKFKIQSDLSLADDPAFKQRMMNYFIMRTHIPNIGKAMAQTELGGSKVNNFSRALAGDPNAVTLDIWMARALGLNDQEFFQDAKLYELAADSIRELAAEEGVEPRQYQAAVWTGIRKEQGKKSGGSSFDSLLPEFWENFAAQCFRPKVKIPKSPSKWPLLEGVPPISAWVLGNCKLALRCLRFRQGQGSA